MNMDVDAAISAITARQHGLIAREQLAQLKLGREARRTRERRRQLHPVQGCPDVFAAGHPTLGEEATILSAVLACGPRAYAAGEHAEWLWELRPPWPPFPSLLVTVTVPRGCGRNPPAARVLRRDLPGAEWQRRRGIPVVSVERLIADAGAERELWAVERLLDRAFIQRLTSLASLERQLERAKGQKGAWRSGRCWRRNDATQGSPGPSSRKRSCSSSDARGSRCRRSTRSSARTSWTRSSRWPVSSSSSTARGGTGPAAARSRIAGRSCGYDGGAGSSCGTRRGRCSRSRRPSSRISLASWRSEEHELLPQTPRFHAG